MAYVPQRTWLESGPRRRGFGELPAGPLDTSGLALSPAGILSPEMTALALDSLPLTGAPVVNLIDYASTAGPAAPTVNWWLVGAAVAVLGAAVMMPTGRKGRR